MDFNSVDGFCLIASCNHCLSKTAQSLWRRKYNAALSWKNCYLWMAISALKTETLCLPYNECIGTCLCVNGTKTYQELTQFHSITHTNSTKTTEPHIQCIQTARHTIDWELYYISFPTYMLSTMICTSWYNHFNSENVDVLITFFIFRWLTIPLCVCVCVVSFRYIIFNSGIWTGLWVHLRVPLYQSLCGCCLWHKWVDICLFRTLHTWLFLSF